MCSQGQVIGAAAKNDVGRKIKRYWPNLEFEGRQDKHFVIYSALS
jgi:hypothetical protein